MNTITHIIHISRSIMIIPLFVIIELVLRKKIGSALVVLMNSPYITIPFIVISINYGLNIGLISYLSFMIVGTVINVSIFFFKKNTEPEIVLAPITLSCVHLFDKGASSKDMAKFVASMM